MRYYLGILMACFIVSCTQNDVNELENLYVKEMSVWCKLNNLQDSINLKWDNVNYLLEEALPDDTPMEEKKNILAVRNAGLIRMFEAYRALDTAVQNQISMTENIDTEIAYQVTMYRKELTEIEKMKSQIISKLGKNKSNQQLVTELNTKYLKDNPCSL